MITVGERWHYIAVKSLSRLLRGITSTDNGNHHCIDCLHLFRTESKLKSHKNVSSSHNYCSVKMIKTRNKVL